MIKTDVLIVGSGISGMTAALTAAEKGLSVILTTKERDLVESNSAYAQGGIVYRGKHDSPEKLARDIITAGAGMCNPAAVDTLVHDGPKLVEELLMKKLHVPFTFKDGEADLTREAAHSIHRIAHAHDATGRAIVAALAKKVVEVKNIKIFTNFVGIDIITPQHHSRDPRAVYHTPAAIGVYFLDQKTNKVKGVLAKAVILATGGVGALYRHTTNPECATGDGIAMALRAGARIINLEYTQFHPTALYVDGERRFLISEALRGEGAILKTRDGKEFMQRYHKDGCLAPRDIVARAIQTELFKRKEEFVYLDIKSVMPRDKILERFPTIAHTCKKAGVDITRDMIPVVPAMHFMCGGISVDIDGKTNIQRLYVVGESSCTGLHGANRLASTSLLEGLVWGHRAACDIKHNWKKLSELAFPSVPDWDDSGLSRSSDPALIRQDWQTLKTIMWNYVGLIRTRERLQRATDDLRHLEEEVEYFYRNTKLTDGLIELRNAIVVGLEIARAAWHNRESRGCHYRES